MDYRLEKIVSGGQTGVDRAGLDAALKAGIPIGGYCPEGRLAEDGRIPDRYPLMEMAGGGYSDRTEKNVAASDGTLILNMGRLTDGTLLTAECAEKYNKPCLILHLEDNPRTSALADWLVRNKIRILNVAGPRESKLPGIYYRAFRFCEDFFRSTTGTARKDTQ